MTCVHGINHSGKRHGCDGCCKAPSPPDITILSEGTVTISSDGTIFIEGFNLASNGVPMDFTAEQKVVLAWAIEKLQSHLRAIGQESVPSLTTVHGPRCPHGVSSNGRMCRECQTPVAANDALTAEQQRSRLLSYNYDQLAETMERFREDCEEWK